MGKSMADRVAVTGRVPLHLRARLDDGRLDVEKLRQWQKQELRWRKQQLKLSASRAMSK